MALSFVLVDGAFHMRTIAFLTAAAANISEFRFGVTFRVVFGLTGASPFPSIFGPLFRIRGLAEDATWQVKTRSNLIQHPGFVRA